MTFKMNPSKRPFISEVSFQYNPIWPDSFACSWPSIVPADNNPNWENAPTNPSTNNNIANRPTSSTHSRSKHRQSDNTNEQLAKVPSQLANTLNSNQTPRPNTNTRELKPTSPTLSVALSLTSSTISCFNVTYISILTQHNLTWTLWRSTLQWPILLE